MAWLAVDKDGQEWIFDEKPRMYDDDGYWMMGEGWYDIPLPKGSIKKLIGRGLTWEDEPVELKEKE